MLKFFFNLFAHFSFLTRHFHPDGRFIASNNVTILVFISNALFPNEANKVDDFIQVIGGTFLGNCCSTALRQFLSFHKSVSPSATES